MLPRLLVTYLLWLLCQGPTLTQAWTVPKAGIDHEQWSEHSRSLSNALLGAESAHFLNRRQAACGAFCLGGTPDSDTPACRAPCTSSGSCGVRKRDHTVITEANATTLAVEASDPDVKSLVKRVFQPVLQNNLAAYVRDNTFASPGRDAYFGIRIHDFFGTEGQDQTDVRLELLNNGRAAFQQAAGPLVGCTVVVIVSKRAVYMGHFWETTSWSCTLTAQRENCLNWFTGATPRGGDPNAQPFNVNLFNGANDDTRVYIMHPRNRRSHTTIGNPQSSNYRRKILDLKATIRGVLGENIPLVLFNYRAIDDPPNYNELPQNLRDPDQPLLGNSERGCALFQYDPTGNGAGQPGWRLFFEHHVFRDTDPIPGPESADGIPD